MGYERTTALSPTVNQVGSNSTNCTGDGAHCLLRTGCTFTAKTPFRRYPGVAVGGLPSRAMADEEVEVAAPAPEEAPAEAPAPAPEPKFSPHDVAISAAQIQELWASPTTDAGLVLLARCIEMPEEAFEEDLRSQIWVDLLYGVIDFAKNLELTPIKAKAFLNVMTALHGACIEAALLQGAGLFYIH